MTTLLLFFLSLIQSTDREPSENISGRVVAEDGSPIAGVLVNAQGVLPETLTDKAGRFTIAVMKFTVLRERSTVRFSGDGYRPITKLLSDATAEYVITLQKASDSSWNVGNCTVIPQLTGFSMGFVLPKGAKVRYASDIDYVIANVEFKKHRMRFGNGFNWSFGFPFSSQLHNMREMSERDVFFGDNVRGVEYRGVRTNGTYYRFIGMVGSTIEYDDVPKELSIYFDGIMDTLCKPIPKSK